METLINEKKIKIYKLKGDYIIILELEKYIDFYEYEIILLSNHIYSAVFLSMDINDTLKSPNTETIIRNIHSSFLNRHKVQKEKVNKVIKKILSNIKNKKIKREIVLKAFFLNY